MLIVDLHDFVRSCVPLHDLPIVLSHQKPMALGRFGMELRTEWEGSAGVAADDFPGLCVPNLDIFVVGRCQELCPVMDEISGPDCGGGENGKMGRAGKEEEEGKNETQKEKNHTHKREQVE